LGASRRVSGPGRPRGPACRYVTVCKRAGWKDAIGVRSMRIVDEPDEGPSLVVRQTATRLSHSEPRSSSASGWCCRSSARPSTSRCPEWFDDRTNVRVRDRLRVREPVASLGGRRTRHGRVHSVRRARDRDRRPGTGPPELLMLNAKRRPAADEQRAATPASFTPRVRSPMPVRSQGRSQTTVDDR
jgi:hypothetical protein